MICEKCGNTIPEGAEVCQNCGEKVYHDTDMDDLLSELSLALDELKSDAYPDAEGSTEPIVVEAPEAPEYAESADSAFIAGSEVSEDEPVEAADARNDELAADSLITGAIAAAAVTEAVVEEPEITEKPDKAEKRSASSKKSAKPSAAGKSTKKASSNGKKKKKKKKKKKNSGSGILGIIIGLLFALLLIAVAAFYMLFRMGFFTSLNSTDDELLYNSAAEAAVEATAEPSAPTEIAIDVEEPVAVEESGLEEDASAEEAFTEEVPVEEPDDTPEEPEAESVEVTSFKLSSDEHVKIYSRGTTSQIEYKIKPSSAASKIEWSSDDESIATVSGDGIISAKRGGECVITGVCGEYSITVNVTCDFNVPETVLDMNYEDVTFTYEGQNLQLEIDSDELTLAQQKSIAWESSDEAVAVVDDDGVVSAVADGTAVITGSIGDYTASCIVRCVNVTGNRGVNSNASPYIINFEDVTLTRKGEYFQLTITSIDNSDIPDFSWKSDDKSVATVSADGIVTAVANGTANITASVGGDNFQCIVRVHFSD